MAQPLARQVAEQIAIDKGVCIHPVSLRRTDLATGASEIIDVPCGSTLESRCPARATRKRSIRRTQCETGWHLDQEPLITPDEPSDVQRAWVEQRAVATAQRDHLAASGMVSSEELTELDQAIADLDTEITASGLRGSVSPGSSPAGRARRVRSTKRRHTAASLVIAAGADVKIIQQMLGHATATMTLDTYGHLFPDHLDEVADAVDAGLARALTG